MQAYLYLLNTLADWEIAYLTVELNSGRFLNKEKAPVELIKIGNTLEPITTMGGIKIAPDKSIDSINFKGHDLLILPGADTWLEEDHKKIMAALSEPDHNITVAAICGATLALAENGLLNQIEHTSNDLTFLKMTCPNYRGESHYQDQPVVTAGNMITATGLAPLEFTYAVLKKIDVMKTDTLEAWYQLYQTKEARYFFQLMESLKK